jgi:hypothetical protein
VATLDDPQLLLFRDRLFDASDKETHLFWQATKYESKLLMPKPAPDHRFTQTYAFPLKNGIPDRVTLTVHAQPIGRDVLEPLVASGDLEPSVVEAIPTFDVATVEWTAADGFGCVPKDAFSP